MIPSFDVQAFNEPIYKKIMGLEANATIRDWYSLLGLAKFESDEAKIDEAMLQRFEQARRYQVGNYEDQALRLIDELGRAYACLTDDDARRSYDRTLGGKAGSDAVADAIEEVLLSDVVETNESSANAATALIDSVGTKTTKGVPPDDRTCPQCGKPTSPKAPVCYHCGFKKESALERRATGKPVVGAAPGMSLRELVQQDLSPQQLLGRLQVAKKLFRARNLAIGLWNAPQQDRKTRNTEPGSRCGRCGRGLMNQMDAHGMRESDVRDTLEFIQSYARKLESLRREQFEWPLSEDRARRIRQGMSGFRPDEIGLYCQTCATKFIQSPRVES